MLINEAFMTATKKLQAKIKTYILNKGEISRFFYIFPIKITVCAPGYSNIRYSKCAICDWTGSEVKLHWEQNHRYLYLNKLLRF